jgi:hypothetical protein
LTEQRGPGLAGAADGARSEEAVDLLATVTANRAAWGGADEVRFHVGGAKVYPSVAYFLPSGGGAEGSEEVKELAAEPKVGVEGERQYAVGASQTAGAV